MVGEQEAARKSFFVVCVPADGEKQLEEWAVALPDDKEAQIGCLTDRLRAHFKQSGNGNSTAEQQEIFKKQLLSQLPKDQTMTDDMLQMMLGMDSLVDSFPLMLNTRAVSHVGVNMYVDDKGTAKGLPTNVRASAIAQACGKMIEVRGDAFIARVFDNDDDFVRMDFRVSEVSMDADWIKIGKEQSASPASMSAFSTAKKALPTAVHVCGAAMCSANASLRCSRCKNQHYCSAKCQKADWKTHKLSCTKASVQANEQADASSPFPFIRTAPLSTHQRKKDKSMYLTPAAVDERLSMQRRRCARRVAAMPMTTVMMGKTAVVLLALVCSSSHAQTLKGANSTSTSADGTTNSSSSSPPEERGAGMGDLSLPSADPAETAESSSHAMALSLQVTMLFVVFLLLLCVGVCCSLQSLCRKYKCCSSIYGHRDSSFDAMVSRSSSCFREDLLNDDELLRLWICWYCDFANYEMKTACALCGQEKKQKDFSQSPGRKPSAVRPASLYAAAASAGLSFSSATSSSTSSASSGSALRHAGVSMSPPVSSAPSSSSSSFSSHFNPSFLVHTPLEPLPESPSSTIRSGVTLSTPPGSPPSSPLSSSASVSMSTLLIPNQSTQLNQQLQQQLSFSDTLVRRKEWQTRFNEHNQIVWTRSVDLLLASGSMSMDEGHSHQQQIDSNNHRLDLHKTSLSSPSSFSSSLPSPSPSIEPIVQATAFVSRTVNSTSLPSNNDTAMHLLHHQSQSQSQHGTVYLEPAEDALVHASLEAQHTDPSNLSCGVYPHAVESVRELSFPEKHRWFMQETSSILNVRWDTPSTGSELLLVMPRDDLMRATTQGLMQVSQKQLHRPLRVQFMNEPGIDAGGIVREWFQLVVAEFLNDTHGLFQSVHTSEDGIAYTINSNASIAVDEYLLQLRAFGRLLGKALLEGHLVSAPLTDVMFKHILSAPISFADLQAVDSKLAHSLQLLWETPLTEGGDEDDDGDDSYALDFSIYHTAMGTVDLKPNGRNIEVTERNKKEYVTLFVRWHLANSVSDEIGALVSGVYDVVPVHLLAPFDYKELRLLLCGSPTIDVNDWEEHTVVLGKKSRSLARLTTWFWRILRSLSTAEQGRILQFATGSARVPIQGFKALTASDGRLCPFTINCLPKPECPYLRAFTCFNRLDVPLYRNEKELEQAIAMLLQMDVTGFSLQ